MNGGKSDGTTMVLLFDRIVRAGRMKGSNRNRLVRETSPAARTYPTLRPCFVSQFSGSLDEEPESPPISVASLTLDVKTRSYLLLRAHEPYVASCCGSM